MTEALKNYINGSKERDVYDCYTDGSCKTCHQITREVRLILCCTMTRRLCAAAKH